MFYRIFLFLLFFVSTISAQQDKTLPLEKELLPEPILLDCGLTITEWRGKRQLDENKLNDICNLAVNNFPTFLNIKKLKRSHDFSFIWKGSFIPSGSCNRCMNDLKDRFNIRKDKRSLAGWTYYKNSYIFVDINDSNFKATFAHELFHALTYYYDITLTPIKEEQLACEFTQFLGLGL